MPDDVIYGEVLEDGTVKTTTGKISAPNHTSAVNVLRGISNLTGGTTTTTKATDVRQHDHVHDHVHDHQ